MHASRDATSLLRTRTPEDLEAVFRVNLIGEPLATSHFRPSAGTLHLLLAMMSQTQQSMMGVLTLCQLIVCPLGRQPACEDCMQTDHRSITQACHGNPACTSFGNGDLPQARWR